MKRVLCGLLMALASHTVSTIVSGSYQSNYHWGDR